MVAVRGPRGRTRRAVSRACDAIDRLTGDNTSGTSAHTYAYSYDSRGNILTNNESGTVITHTYDAASRLTTSIEGSDITSYTFDNNGNMTFVEKGLSNVSMAYDPENQLGYHEDETGDATFYSYDPFQHLKQDVRLVGTNRWYLWLDDMIVRMDDTSGVKRVFTTLDGKMVGEVHHVTGSPATKYYLFDLLASVVGITTPASFAVTDSRRISPYGRVFAGAAVTAHNPAWIGGYGYHLTGLGWAEYMAVRRIVSTRTSQWTTRDMLWPDELAYGYVNGNPTTRVDPSGLLVVSSADFADSCFSLGQEPANSKDFAGFANCVLEKIKKLKKRRPSDLRRIVDECLRDFVVNVTSDTAAVLCCLMYGVKDKNGFPKNSCNDGMYADPESCCDMTFCACMLPKLTDKYEYYASAILPSQMVAGCLCEARAAKGCYDGYVWPNLPPQV